MKHVAILMGGWSAEREVSLRSGAACANALAHGPFMITCLDVNRNISDKLEKLKPDVALNILHGGFGEDGHMQAILETLGIPYSHSGVRASELAMNKARARDVFRASNVPVADGKTVSRFDAAKSHPLPAPYVVKPIADGSSMGVVIVRSESESPPAELADESWQFGDEVLVEKYVAGHELTCAVMGDTALDVIEIISDLSFYNYQAKYEPGSSRHLLPAPIPNDIYKRVQELALLAHRSLGCRGVSRSDFRYDDKTGELVCLEVNTQPGMTEMSLVPELASKAGLSFRQLVEWMIEDASLNR